MPIQSSGQITLSNLQTEFGGSNPVDLSEYYKNGVYVPDTTSYAPNVPTAGGISLSQFRGAYKCKTFAETQNIVKSTDYATYRNNMFSKYVITDGFETNTSLAWVQNNAGNRYATSVTGSLSWVAGAQNTNFNPFSKLTAIFVNHGAGAQVVGSCIHNGTSYTNTAIFDGVIYHGHKRSYKFLDTPYGGLNSNHTVTATYLKSSNNTVNGQEMFVLPGQWRHIQTVSGSTILSAVVQTGDLLLAHWGQSGEVGSDKGFFGGVSITSIMSRGIRWYSSYGTDVVITSASGTASYSSVNYTTGGTTYYNPAVMSVFRLERT